MDVINEILEKSTREAEKYKPITVKKHLDLEYDLGTLLAIDNNEFDSTLLRRDRNDYFLNLARDNTQLLLNQIWELPTERVDEAIMVKLPSPKTVLPRMKPVPKPRPLTKWQRFAKEKGITKKKKTKLSWDEQLKTWVPLYGFKRAKAQRDKDWVLQVPQNADPMEDQFAKKLGAKIERVAKNDFQRMRNIAKARNIKVPRMGLTNPDIASAKDLQAAVTVAKASTASLGKFQNKLPKEKEARGVTEITPGASRKRKLPYVSANIEKTESLAIVDAVLSKRPKIDVDRAVNIQISQNSEGGHNKKQRTNKKPKGGKGQRKGKGGGRKRR